jgi:hypothetical protein
MSDGKKTEKIGKIESLSKSGDAAKKQIAILKRWKSLVAEAMLKSVQNNLSAIEKERYASVISNVLETHSNSSFNSKAADLEFVSDLFSNLAVIRLFGIQPLTAPCSSVFHMKYKYEEGTKNVASVLLSVDSCPVQSNSQKVCSIPLNDFTESAPLMASTFLDSIILQDFYHKLPLNYPPENCGLRFSEDTKREEVILNFLNTYANRLHKNNLRGASWILCGTESIKDIISAPVMMKYPTQLISDDISYASRFKLKTWCNSKIPPTAIVFGYMGASFIDSGYVWSPLQFSKLTYCHAVDMLINHAMTLVNPGYYLRVE